MFPDDQEPLARTLAMQASRRNSRRQGIPQGGMPNLVRPMDNLEAQDAMDSMQYEDPPSASPFRLAIGDGNAAPIQTVQQRQSGARMDCSTGQCRLVQQPAQQGQPAQQRSTLAQQLGLPPGSTVTAIDGVPVGQGMGFPTPPPPASFQSLPSGGVVRSQPAESAVTGNGEDYFDRAAARLGAFNPALGSMVGASGDMFRGQMAMRQSLEAPANSREERRVGIQEQMANLEVLTQLANLDAQYEQTAVGLVSTVDDAIRGNGKFTGKDAWVRAAVAAAALQKAHNAGVIDKSLPFDFEQSFARLQGQTAAHDLATMLSQYQVFKQAGQPGQAAEFGKGAAEYLDRAVTAAYVGRKDDKGRLLMGPALEDVMWGELSGPFAEKLTADFMKSYPQANPDAVLNHQRDFTVKIIRSYQAEVEKRHADMMDGDDPGGFTFNDALDYAAKLASRVSGPRTKDYAVTPPDSAEPVTSGTASPSR